MAKLPAKQRNSLPASSFVFPSERKYPIHDLAHAKAALRLSGRDTPARRKKVIAAVLRKYGRNKFPSYAKGSSS